MQCYWVQRLQTCLRSLGRCCEMSQPVSPEPPLGSSVAAADTLDTAALCSSKKFAMLSHLARWEWGDCVAPEVAHYQWGWQLVAKYSGFPIRFGAILRHVLQCLPEVPSKSEPYLSKVSQLINIPSIDFLSSLFTSLVPPLHQPTLCCLDSPPNKLPAPKF